MAIFLLLILSLPVLGLPGPKYGRIAISIPPSLLSISPSSPEAGPAATERSTAPQNWPTGHLSSSVPFPSPPRVSGQPIPPESLSPPTSSGPTVGSPSPGLETSPKTNSAPTGSTSPTRKTSFTVGKPPSLTSSRSSSEAEISPNSSRTTRSSSKKASGSHPPSTRPLSPNTSRDRTSSGNSHSSTGKPTSSGTSTASSSQSSSRGKVPPSPTQSFSPGVAPNGTFTDRPHSPNVTHADPRPSIIPSSAYTRSLSRGAASNQTSSDGLHSSDTSTAGPRRPSSTGKVTHSVSAGSKTNLQTTAATTSSVSLITPHPSSVTVSEVDTVTGVKENTVYKTERDGHETSVPVLFGPRCLIFCHSGKALVLWGIGPRDGSFVLPPRPGISPLPSLIHIKNGIPTPEGTQGSDEGEPTDKASKTEKNSATSTSGGSSTSESTSESTSTSKSSSTSETTTSEASTSESSTSKTTTAESTTLESTSTCTAATITNCAVTTSCGPKSCSTTTTCTPTVADCTATGTTVSTATSEYKLSLDAHTGHSLATPSPSSSKSASSTPSYQLTIDAHTGHGSEKPSNSSSSSSSTSTPSYQLTIDAHTGHKSAKPSPSSSTAAFSTPSYQLTMDVYTVDGQTHQASSVTGKKKPTKSSTFHTYQITTTKVIGGPTYAASPLCIPFADPGKNVDGGCQCSSGQHRTTAPYLDRTSNVCGYTTYPSPKTKTKAKQASPKKTTKAKPASPKTATKAKPAPSKTKTTKLSAPSEKASCYPKSSDDAEDKVIKIADPPVEEWCADPMKVYKGLRDPPRIDYIEAGWTLTKNAPKGCNDLPTKKGDSEGYWVCKVALERIARDCPWNGGTIHNTCGEFRLRGCLGPCDHAGKSS